MKTVTFQMVNPPAGATYWEAVWAGIDQVWHGMTTFKPVANAITVTMADDGQYFAVEAGLPGQAAFYVVAWQGILNFENGATYIWDAATEELSGPGIGGGGTPGTGFDFKKNGLYIIGGAALLGILLAKRNT